MAKYGPNKTSRPDQMLGFYSGDALPVLLYFLSALGRIYLQLN